MPNTRDLSIESGKGSFLFIGDNGSGKTYFLKDMPKPYIADFDSGVASLQGADIEYDMFKDAPLNSKLVDPERGIYKYGDAFPRYIDRMNKLGKMIDEGNCPFETIATDSMTTMLDSAMRAVLARDGKHGKNPEIQHWGTFMTDVVTLLDQLTSWPLFVVFTAHVERAKNPLTDEVEMMPLANSKLQGKIPIYFDEVYFFDVKTQRTNEGKVSKHVIMTRKDSLYKCARSRWRVPNETEASWPAVQKAIREGVVIGRALEIRREASPTPPTRQGSRATSPASS